MIKIICVGKLKEKYWSLAVEEYLKRLSKYSNVQVVEIPDFSLNDINLILDKEAKIIEKNISEKDYVISMDINGVEMDSVKFSSLIDSTLIYKSNIVFIIGGSYGIHDCIKKRSDYRLSFSKMTFPHQMFRVILLEQIYRAYKIINNESYHK